MNVRAYAKVNLTLDIISVRDDGFHSIRSVMVPVSLFDRVSVERAERISFDCDLPALRNEDNLCIRAAKAFFEAAGIRGGADIRLQKHIPFPAGLGGASADAAAVIDCLSTIYGAPLDFDELIRVAAEVGSDVPFCLYGKPALCEGRGEIITPIAGDMELFIVIAIGAGRLSTGEVYAAYDRASLAPTDHTTGFLEALSNGADICKHMGNSFVPIVSALCPETADMRDSLLKCGAGAAMLSGSGPAVYGVFENELSAANAAKVLRAEGYFSVECRTM